MAARHHPTPSSFSHPLPASSEKSLQGFLGVIFFFFFSLSGLPSPLEAPLQRTWTTRLPSAHGCYSQPGVVGAPPALRGQSHLMGARSPLPFPGWGFSALGTSQSQLLGLAPSLPQTPGSSPGEVGWRVLTHQRWGGSGASLPGPSSTRGSLGFTPPSPPPQPEVPSRPLRERRDGGGGGMRVPPRLQRHPL